MHDLTDEQHREFLRLDFTVDDAVKAGDPEAVRKAKADRKAFMLAHGLGEGGGMPTDDNGDPA